MPGQRVRTTESKAPAVLAGLVVALLVAGGAALVLGDGLTGGSSATSSAEEKCASVTLTAPASIAEPVAAAVDTVVEDLGCDSIVVVPASLGWGQKPDTDLWVAESSALVAAVAGAEPLVDSLASTPVVSTVGPLAKTWQQEFATGTVGTKAPLKHLPSALALLAAQTGTEANEFDALVVQTAQGTTDDAASGAATVSTEQATRTAGRSSWAPPATAFMDFPLVQLSERAIAGRVGTAVAQWFTTTPGKQALAKVHLRGADREPLDAESSKLALAPISGTTTQAITDLDTRWQQAHQPLNALLVLDASGSMRQEVNGIARAELATATLTPVVEGLASASRFGLWSFAVRSTSAPGQFWQELAPQRELRRTVAGSTQRASLKELLQEYRNDLEGGTGLFDTTLAAYRSAMTNYRPGHRNVVVLVSDGSNDDTDSLALDSLVAELKALRSKQRPVQIVGVSVAPEGTESTLTEIVAATGGTTLTIKPGAEVADELYRALVSPNDAGGSNG